MLDDSEIPSQLSEQSKARSRKAGQRRMKRFLKGPVPLNWLERAAKLGGKSMNLAILIWYRSGLTNSDKDIVVGDALAKQFGISRQARCRILRSMEHAGLVKVTWENGKLPRVALLGATSTEKLSADEVN